MGGKDGMGSDPGSDSGKSEYSLKNPETRGDGFQGFGFL